MLREYIDKKRAQNKKNANPAHLLMRKAGVRVGH